jgi:hypothetical protein
MPVEPIPDVQMSADGVAMLPPAVDIEALVQKAVDARLAALSPASPVASVSTRASTAEFFQQRPQRVAMVGLGPSANAFWLENAQFNAPAPYEAVWVVNRAAVSFKHDATFDMHDLRAMVQKYPHERHRLATNEKPIVTLAHYPEFPTSIPYPIAAVLDFIGHDILNSTPAYMIAYALMIGVKEIWLYGMDFHYENLDRAEAGGQGMAYLLGMCHAAGVNYRIPNTSSLLDAYRVRLVETPDGRKLPLRPLYGYAESPAVGDPRIPEGAKVTELNPPQQQMTAHQPRYRLGEAEAGDAGGKG